MKSQFSTIGVRFQSSLNEYFTTWGCCYFGASVSVDLIDFDILARGLIYRLGRLLLFSTALLRISMSKKKKTGPHVDRCDLL